MMATVIDLREPRRNENIGGGLQAFGNAMSMLAQFKRLKGLDERQIQQDKLRAEQIETAEERANAALGLRKLELEHRQKVESRMEEHSADQLRLARESVDLEKEQLKLKQNQQAFDLFTSEANAQQRHEDSVRRQSRLSANDMQNFVNQNSEWMTPGQVRNMLNTTDQFYRRARGDKTIGRELIPSTMEMMKPKINEAQKLLDLFNKSKRTQGDSAQNKQLDLVTGGLIDITTRWHELTTGEIDTALNAGRSLAQRGKFQTLIDLPGFLPGGKRNVSNIRVADLTKEELLIANENKDAYSKEQRDAIAEYGLLRGWLKKAKK